MTWTLTITADDGQWIVAGASETVEFALSERFDDEASAKRGALQWIARWELSLAGERGASSIVEVTQEEIDAAILDLPPS